MKVLIKKLKQSNKIFLSIFIFVFLTFFVSYIFIVKSLLSLSGIETMIRSIIIVLFGIWLISYLVWNLVNLITKKHITLSITSLITILFAIIFFFVSYYIDVIYSNIDRLSDSEYVTYTSDLIVLSDTNLNQDSQYGMINNSEDIEGYILAKKLIERDQINPDHVVEYSSYYEMIDDLFNKKIDGIFLTSNYLAIFGGEDGFKDLANTKVASYLSEKMKNKDIDTASNKSLKEPFTILLMGVDSEGEGIDASSSFNGDTLMLITFNPKTLNTTMFSIPRDTYVPIACNNNQYAKINSAAAYGTSCVIDTIKQLTDIDIDYYLKVNFKAVVDLVEALNGIDVNVEVPDYGAYYHTYNGRVCEQNSLRQFGENLVCMDTGIQHLNGEQALAYARCRHAYLQSDIARTKHQQAIIEAIAKKAIDPSNINKVEEILNSISSNLATNMSTNQILSLYDVLKSIIINTLSDGEMLTINKTYLEYYDLNVRTSQNGWFTSAIGYYPGSLEAIVKLMKENLEIESPQMISDFTFDANESYEIKATGQGIRSGERLETMPNFIGKSIQEVENWAISHNVTVNKEFVDEDSEHFNQDTVAGVVANQSINYGVLLKNINELTIYINNTTAKKPSDIPSNPEDDQENDTNDNGLNDILPNE